MDTISVLSAVILLILSLFVFRRVTSPPPPPVVYAGRQLVDIELQKKHGLRHDERRPWRRAEIKKHNKVDDLWLIIDNKVYDVTAYVEDHAGGTEAIMRNP